MDSSSTYIISRRTTIGYFGRFLLVTEEEVNALITKPISFVETHVHNALRHYQMKLIKNYMPLIGLLLPFNSSFTYIDIDEQIKTLPSILFVAYYHSGAKMKEITSHLRNMTDDRLWYARLKPNNEIKKEWDDVVDFGNTLKPKSQQDLQPEYLKKGKKTMIKKFKDHHDSSKDRIEYIESIK